MNPTLMHLDFLIQGKWFEEPTWFLHLPQGVVQARFAMDVLSPILGGRKMTGKSIMSECECG